MPQVQEIKSVPTEPWYGVPLVPLSRRPCPQPFVVKGIQLLWQLWCNRFGF